MSDLERIRERVLEKHLVENVAISTEDYRKLSREERKKCFDVVGDSYYPTKLDIPPEDIDSFLALISFEAQIETKNAIVTIKNIVVVMFVLSIIASILWFFIQANSY